MTVCDLCVFLQSNGECSAGLKLAKGMSCREFGPGIERFCSNPNDFENSKQVMQMASFFGLKGTELKKVKLMAAVQDTIRLKN